MKSVGEAFQKGLRMLDLGLKKIKKIKKKSVIKILKDPKYSRIEVIEDAFENGLSVDNITKLTKKFI